MGRWVDGTNDLSTKRLMFQNPVNLFFYFFITLQELRVLSAQSLSEIVKKNNTWNIRRLVDESFGPATQRIILKIVRFQSSELGPN